MGFTTDMKQFADNTCRHIPGHTIQMRSWSHTCQWCRRRCGKPAWRGRTRQLCHESLLCCTDLQCENNNSTLTGLHQDDAFSATTLLVGRQDENLTCKKTEWWGAGVVICLKWSANELHMVHLMPLPPLAHITFLLVLYNHLWTLWPDL